MKEVLSANNIKKYYGNNGVMTKAIDGIDLRIQSGEFLGIMGPSGSGKTTLLNLLSTIDGVTSGQIIINGIDITKIKSKQMSKFRRENLGFIFQDFNLLDTLTIEENIALALTINKVAPIEIKKRVSEIAMSLGIEQILAKYPSQVSGGQKQRAAAARAIINSPSLVLADEPTGALDSAAARKLLQTLEGINQNLETTILMVTHDAYAASYCKSIIFIKDGKVFTRLNRGEQSREHFFKQILEVVAVIGGGIGDAI